MLAQIGIAVLGLLSIFLANDVNPRLRRFACIAGLCAQPFWFWATWQAQQWGIFAMAFVYTAMWARGLWNFWILPWRREREERDQRDREWCTATGDPRP